MKGSIQDYCKLGIVHFMLYKFAGTGEGKIADSVNVGVCCQVDGNRLQWARSGVIGGPSDRE